jgi:hypothetical protein
LAFQLLWSAKLAFDQELTLIDHPREIGKRSWYDWPNSAPIITLTSLSDFGRPIPEAADKTDKP